MLIIPTIEEQDIAEFERKFKVYAGFALRIQLDFNDGSFQNFKTITPQQAAEAIGKAGELPELEVHLLWQNPLSGFEALRRVGVKRFIFQFEIEGNLRELLEQVHSEDLKIGVAIGPETTVEELEPLGELIDIVIVMTIHPGTSGQQMLVEELQKVRELREGNFWGEIEIDGGVNPDTVKFIKEVMPDGVAVNKYIGDANNPEEKYRELVSLLNE